MIFQFGALCKCYRSIRRRIFTYPSFVESHVSVRSGVQCWFTCNPVLDMIRKSSNFHCRSCCERAYFCTSVSEFDIIESPAYFVEPYCKMEWFSLVSCIFACNLFFDSQPSFRYSAIQEGSHLCFSANRSLSTLRAHIKIGLNINFFHVITCAYWEIFCLA